MRSLIALFVACLVCACVGSILEGCSPSKSAASVNTNEQQAVISGKSEGIKDAAGRIQDTAGKIENDTHEPVTKERAQSVKRDAATIFAKADDVAAVEGQLKTIDAKYSGQIQGLQGELDKANSATANRFRALAIIATIAIGLSIAIGVWCHDTTYAAAGVAGGGTILGVSLFVLEVAPMLKWIAVGLVAVAAVAWVIQWVRSRQTGSSGVVTVPSIAAAASSLISPQPGH